MEAITSIKPVLAVLVSLTAVPFIIRSRSPNIREVWTFLAGLIKFGIVISMLPIVLNGQTVIYSLIEVLPGIAIKFRVDAFGLLFAIVSSFLWIITSAYSIGYMRGLHEHSQTRFFAFFAISLSATVGVAFSANLFTMYMFYEMLSLATYPLVTHHQDKEARSSGRKYLLYLLGTSIGFLLPAILMVYIFSGTLEFASMGIVGGTQSMGLITLMLLLFVFGFAKAAIMPLHSWLPAAMVAPTPVSALLHAVAVVKVGAFCIFRVITDVFGIGLLSNLQLGPLITYIAAFTIIVASLIALSQDELKRMLAFSTVGQLSYIVLGAALMSSKALTAGMIHIAMHAFGKIILFFCAGAIYISTGKKYISELTGIGRKMPLTMAAFLIGSLSVIGLPPTGGFLSKWYLILGALDAEYFSILVVILCSAFLNTAYLMPIVYRAFFCKQEDSNFDDKIAEAPLFCLIPIVITALISLALLFYPQPFFALASMAVENILGK